MNKQTCYLEVSVKDELPKNSAATFIMIKRLAFGSEFTIIEIASYNNNTGFFEYRDEHAGDMVTFWLKKVEGAVVLTEDLYNAHRRQWISIKDRMPNDQTDVTIYLNRELKSDNNTIIAHNINGLWVFVAFA